jgi:hypothetical protein
MWAVERKRGREAWAAAEHANSEAYMNARFLDGSLKDGNVVTTVVDEDKCELVELRLGLRERLSRPAVRPTAVSPRPGRVRLFRRAPGRGRDPPQTRAVTSRT